MRILRPSKDQTFSAGDRPDHAGQIALHRGFQDAPDHRALGDERVDPVVLTALAISTPALDTEARNRRFGSSSWPLPARAASLGFCRRVACGGPVGDHLWCAQPFPFSTLLLLTLAL